MCSRLISGFMLTLLCAVATADQSLDVSLSADTARFEYQSPLGESGFNNTHLNLGFLYTDDDDVVGFAGAQILDEVGSGSPGLKLGIGTRAYFASIEDADI
ncbi:MAG: hypothetical protein GXP10_05150, partial [Gammaproteobacteria bacterium]|nr:hypothetical protein [Gammaproteobacteria bacterium]